VSNNARHANTNATRNAILVMTTPLYAFDNSPKA